MIAETPQAPLSGAASRDRPRPRLGRLTPPVLVLAVTGLGAADFLWRLGSSSYFVDEVLSIQHALPALGTVNSLVSKAETTPWTFFWGLHFWLHITGSETEWVTRLPSALAGAVLVAAVYWMARAFVDRAAALLAALLTALSPLVLTYAQQVRVYVFVLLALTLAVGLTVRAASEGPPRARRLVLGAAAAVLALWLHYTAALVVAPLCVWLAARRELSLRSRAGFVGACLAGVLIELPLFVHQYHYAPNGGIGATGAITGPNAVRVLETPFDGRFVASVNALRIIGLLALVVSIAVLAGGALEAARAPVATGAGVRVRSPGLLIALGVTAPAVILILGAAGKDVVITRYTAVAAPMLLTAIAAAVLSLPRGAALPLAALAAAAAICGVVSIHQRTGFDAPARETIAFIQSHPQHRATLAIPGHPGADIPLGYYARRDLHPAPALVVATDQAAVVRIFHERRPVWFVVERHSFTSTPAALRRFLDRVLARYRYTAGLVKPITTSTTFVVELLLPQR